MVSNKCVGHWVPDDDEGEDVVVEVNKDGKLVSFTWSDGPKILGITIDIDDLKSAIDHADQ